MTNSSDKKSKDTGLENASNSGDRKKLKSLGNAGLHPALRAIKSNVSAAARVLAPLLLLSGPVMTMPSCKPDEIVDVKPPEEPEKPKFTKEIGNWRFDVMEITETTFQLEGDQKYFYDYVKAGLADQKNTDLSLPKDLETFTNALIGITKDLNPELDFDKPDQLVGKKIKIPSKVYFVPAEGKFFRSRVGYKYLRKAAKADGMNIEDTGVENTDSIYAEAMKNPLMPDSEFYVCKSVEVNCKEPFAPDAHLIFEQFAKDFYEESGGWKIVYNDIMRDREDQESQSGGTKLGTTHITARTLDIGVFRYITPDGTQVSYGKATAEQKEKIDNELKTLLVKLLSQYSNNGTILVMDETHGGAPHYHIYINKSVRQIEPQVIELNVTGDPATVQVPPEKGPDKPKIVREISMHQLEQNSEKYYVFTIPDWKLSRFLEILCKDSSEETVNRIKKFNKKKPEDKLMPGNAIKIPYQLLKPEIQNPVIVEISLPEKVNKTDYLASILKEGTDAGIYLIYTPQGSKNIRLPKSLLR